jgi:hypothetical protein
VSHQRFPDGVCGETTTECRLQLFSACKPLCLGFSYKYFTELKQEGLERNVQANSCMLSTQRPFPSVSRDLYLFRLDEFSKTLKHSCSDAVKFGKFEEPDVLHGSDDSTFECLFGFIEVLARRASCFSSSSRAFRKSGMRCLPGARSRETLSAFSSAASTCERERTNDVGRKLILYSQGHLLWHQI